MTREEAIKVLNMVEAHGLAEEAKQMAISALKSIEQIRAEIERERFNHIESRYDKGYDDAITDILKLIDKYTK